MWHIQKRGPVLSHITHSLLTLLLERIVSDRKDFVADQDIRSYDRCDRKAKTGRHTGRIVLDRHIHEIFEFCKLDDLFVMCIHEFFAVTENGAIQIDVFRRSQFAVESGAQLDQGCDTSLYRAPVRLHDAADQF